MMTSVILIIAVVMFFKSPLPVALSEALRNGARAGGGDPHAREAMERLTGEVELLRSEVGELAERVDFAERMLLEVRERTALPGGAALLGIGWHR